MKSATRGYAFRSPEGAPAPERLGTDVVSAPGLAQLRIAGHHGFAQSAEAGPRFGAWAPPVSTEST